MIRQPFASIQGLLVAEASLIRCCTRGGFSLTASAGGSAPLASKRGNRIAASIIRPISYFDRCYANALLVVFSETELGGMFDVPGLPNECVLVRIAMRARVDIRWRAVPQRQGAF